MIRCGRRKEKKCKEAPETCIWDGEKCAFQNKLSQVKASKRKESSVSPNHVVPQQSKPPVKHQSSSPPFVSDLKRLENRHCVYYASNASHRLEHTDRAHIRGCHKTPYDPSFKSTTNVHIGQRKLLLSEIQLLTEYFEKQSTPSVVLYVGAAPGTHLVLLSQMFPNVKFVLYDGARFDPILKRFPETFELHEGESGFVTTPLVRTLAKRFASTHMLFVSDIRLGDDDKHAFEQGVVRDMQLQQEWMEILKPKMSLLKFRMSYNMKHGDKLTYTKGNLLYGIWAKPTSGETRLLVRGKDVGKHVSYDFKDYEETMFFHNKFRRPYCFSLETSPPDIRRHVMSPKNVYCPCYDCLAELNVLYRYTMFTRRTFDDVLHQFARHMNPGKQIAFQRRK